jgi:hypothetical protein
MSSKFLDINLQGTPVGLNQKCLTSILYFRAHHNARLVFTRESAGTVNLIEVDDGMR